MHVTTPKLRSADLMKVDQSPRKLRNYLEHQYTIHTQTISVTSIMTSTVVNSKYVTIIATNCIPHDIQIPLCKDEPSQFPDIPSFPLINPN